MGATGTAISTAISTAVSGQLPVCTAQPCSHNGVEQKHDRDHTLCEHCTVSVVSCQRCQLVSALAPEDLLLGGWIRITDRSGTYYRCGTCGVM